MALELAQHGIASGRNLGFNFTWVMGLVLIFEFHGGT
jgi:hypothetical protein